MKSYLQLSKQELLIEYKRVKNIYETLKGQNLSLNMARGKPSKEQLDLSKEMLTILDKTTDFQMDNQDIRNYGVLDGLKCTRDLFAQMMNVSSDQIIIGGNSSLNMMYDQIMRSFVFGIDGQTPWSQLKKVKWLCPVPGYDRHFKMCENFNIELIPIDMTNFGPDMDQVETYIQDESVKGIWCVPKYSNL